MDGEIDYGQAWSHAVIPVLVVIVIELVLRRPGELDLLPTLAVLSLPLLSAALLWWLGYLNVGPQSGIF